MGKVCFSCPGWIKSLAYYGKSEGQMKANVTAKGYTNIILVLNMKRFVAREHQPYFEKIRGSQAFAQVLREDWPKQILANGRFIPVQEEKHHRDVRDVMSTEEVGFATGIFRSVVLEDFTFPTYMLNKSSIKFPNYLEGNYQFKNIFKRAWNGWKIYIRPSFTGLFIVRLTRKYDKATRLRDMAQDVIKLQESLDVQSARNRLVEVRKKYADNPAERTEKENSIFRFLEWLGADEMTPTRLLYAPVQWKIAMEVCRILVEDVGHCIPITPDPRKLGFTQLVTPGPTLSTPLHDSYIVYHIDEIWADRSFLSGQDPSAPAPSTDLPEESGEMGWRSVRPHHIRNSSDLQQRIGNLIEGSMLRKSRNGSKESSPEDTNRYFPRMMGGLIKTIFDHDMATWDDELCLLTSRAAILMPSLRSHEDELLIATIPSATSNFPYARYWGAVERMIEFIIEVRVLAQLIERASFDLLEDLAKTMTEIRNYLFSGDIRLHEKLPGLIEDAAHLRRLRALCQGLSNPQIWSRAEYAVVKANHLLDQLGIPNTLNYIERNIDSINSVVDHVDEWYMADLAEQSNDMATLLSLGLAAASFILTLLILPSFWADLFAQGLPIENWNGWGSVRLLFTVVGTILAILLIVVGAALSIPSIRHYKQISSVLRRSFVRLEQLLNKREA